MAFIDLMTLDKELIQIQLAELTKVRNRFKEFWGYYHDNYSEMTRVYNRSFIFSVRLEYLFIANGLQSDSAEIEVSSKFSEDLGESVKLREKFLMELIYTTETAIKPKKSETEFKEWLDAERKKREAGTTTHETTNENAMTPQSETHGLPETAAVQKPTAEPRLSEEQLTTAKIVGYYPTFREGAAAQLFDLLKTYFVAEEEPKRQEQDQKKGRNPDEDLDQGLDWAPKIGR
ncbi:hypothetical protein [Mucilaginibacter sp. SG564]|uniref:hypothetical protein n=1 Tax=Mucilaginibacter sp. SG564 TaxID=2587022 RepID=UPI001C12BBF7|nr:hypothetical protein [Mucilaginibacter sp. SG564]NOW97911.1 hypothetical protein [Mucilaginibacter sp. SG564]